MNSTDKFLPGLLTKNTLIRTYEGVVGDDYVSAVSLILDTSKSKTLTAYITNKHASHVIAYEIQYSNNPLDTTPTWTTVPSSAATLAGVTTVEIASKNCIAPAMRFVFKANTGGQTPSFEIVARLNP